jgi:hypothetical protein
MSKSENRSQKSDPTAFWGHESVGSRTGEREGRQRWPQSYNANVGSVRKGRRDCLSG